MAKKITKAIQIDSPTARGKLKASGKPYFVAGGVDGLHLGYRKGKDAGKWVSRQYVGGEKYVVKTIGIADDLSPSGKGPKVEADGAKVLTFNQAQEKARALALAAKQPESKPSLPFTVNEALDAYFAHLDADQGKSVADAMNRADRLIRPTLGKILVADLTRDEIRDWRNAVGAMPRHTRGKKGMVSRALESPKTEEETRKRHASANRTLTVLKAALNRAFEDGKAISDAAWRAVKPFREVESARVRYFTVEEVRRLVNAAQGDFRALVNAALFTGCRYGELVRLKVGDFNPDAGTVFVGKSKSGKARHVVLTDEGQTFFRQLIAGRASEDLMLKRADGGAWGVSHQLRPMREICERAGIAAAGFHTFRHTSASLLVMAGVPLPVVAKNLGHADSRMTERHYAHLAPSYLAETIRKFAPTLGTVEDSNVKSIAC